ncbi:hypothetical protein [Autumnicola musiva]|uniref:Outer membrane protein beta-barrel domain-containing protein n=1 Tax=Autumnicola musiva TaxID=3075589 RepID=A0ABU3D917_9FLAO|nr:hypothetical protein [Zunongwangia sp. F117]MDT0678017.1 hypothetical protein [Zunongwangia sp. F117]
MKRFLRILVIVILIGTGGGVSAQEISQYNNRSQSTEKVRPFRLGLKLGFPNLIGGNVEYVTPLLNDKLAVNVEYSSLDFGFLSELLVGDKESPELKYTYYEGGLNYYFFKSGKGLYVGAGYGALKMDTTLNDVSSEEDDSKTGTGNVKFERNSFSVKLGAKLGALFYFRPEIGYAFMELPKSATMVVSFEDGSTATQTAYLDDYFDTEGSPQKYMFEGFIANIGLGFAF